MNTRIVMQNNKEYPKIMHLPVLFTNIKEKSSTTRGLGITLERRLEERSSSIASENPVPVQNQIDFQGCINI